MRFRKKPLRHPCRCHSNQLKSLILLEALVASVDDVNASLDSLDQSVKDLAARIPQTQDLQPVVDRVNAIKAEVDQTAPAA
jgi:hypothetical protein